MAARLRVSDPGELIAEVPWSEWWEGFRRQYTATREQAQHVTILGPTGTGKSTLAMTIARERPYVAALCAKPRDKWMRGMLREGGYVGPASVLPEAGAGRRRVFIWPRNRNEGDWPEMRRQYLAAFDRAYDVGVWHLLVDEAHFMAESLGLARKIKGAYQMGRSNGHGVILCAQRPAWLPRDIYSSADHLMLYGTNDSVDLKSISGLNGVNDRTVRDVVATLGRDRRFLHVNTATGTMTITRLPERSRL